MSAQENRIYSFDAARAIAAILLIVLHSSLGYLRFPVPEWPSYGQQTSLFFDFLVGAIHMFRLPAFFFLAGFFSYQLLIRLKVWGFIQNCFKRICLPFFFLCLIINSPVILNEFFLDKIHNFKDFLSPLNLSYLWFLEYLLIYCCLLILGSSLLLIPNCKWINDQVEMRLKPHYIGPLIVACVFISLYSCHVWYIPTPLSYIPNIWSLLIYGLYYFLGIILSRHSSSIDYFFKWRMSSFFGGVGFYLLYIFVYIFFFSNEKFRTLAIVFYAISSYLLFLCFFGFCQIFFTKPNQLIRLIADASYWIYLTHIYYLLIFQQVIRVLFNSMYIQFAVTVIMTMFFGFLSFYLFYLARKMALPEFPWIRVSIFEKGGLRGIFLKYYRNSGKAEKLP